MTCCRNPYGIHHTDMCAWCDYHTPTSCTRNASVQLLTAHIHTDHMDRVEADAAYRQAIYDGRGEDAAASAYRVRMNASLTSEALS